MNLKSYRNKQFGEYSSTKDYFDFMTAIYASKYHKKSNVTEDHYNETVRNWKHKLSKKGIEHINGNHDQIEKILKMNINIFKTPNVSKISQFGGSRKNDTKSYPTYNLLMNTDNMFKPIILQTQMGGVLFTQPKPSLVQNPIRNTYHQPKQPGLSIKNLQEEKNRKAVLQIYTNSDHPAQSTKEKNRKSALQIYKKSDHPMQSTNPIDGNKWNIHNMMNAMTKNTKKDTMTKDTMTKDTKMSAKISTKPYKFNGIACTNGTLYVNIHFHDKMREGSWMIMNDSNLPKIIANYCNILPFVELAPYYERFVPGLTKYLKTEKSLKNKSNNPKTNITGGAPPDIDFDENPMDEDDLTHPKVIGFSNTQSYVSHTLRGDMTTPYNILAESKEFQYFHKLVSLTFDNSTRLEDINILYIITGPLQYFVGDNPRDVKTRVDLLRHGLGLHGLGLKTLFGENGKRKVNIHFIHFPDKNREFYNEMPTEYNQDQGLHDRMLQDTDQLFRSVDTFKEAFKYGLSEANIVSHQNGFPHLVFDEVDVHIADDKTDFEGLLFQKEINMIYCHGGETHWLRRQFVKTGFIETLKHHKNIVWSGFSAGIILGGVSTGLAAAKQFSPILNPDREFPGPVGDDVVPILKKNTKDDCQLLTFITSPLNLEYPPYNTCSFDGTSMINKIIFPHYKNTFKKKVRSMDNFIIEQKQHLRLDNNRQFKDEYIVLADGECFFSINNTLFRLPQDVNMHSQKAHILSARCLSATITPSGKQSNQVTVI